MAIFQTSQRFFQKIQVQIQNFITILNLICMNLHKLDQLSPVELEIENRIHFFHFGTNPQSPTV